MTLGKVHDTPLVHRQLGKILPKSNTTVSSYGPDKEFCLVCTVTLTLETKGHDTPLYHGQHYPNPIRQ